MIVNHFKMRTDVLSHNLAGMGCSGGVVALDMAKQFLQARPCLPGGAGARALATGAAWPALYMAQRPLHAQAWPFMALG